MNASDADYGIPKPTAAQLAEEWRYGYLHGYLHGWSDHLAGRQYGEGRYLRAKTPPPTDGSAA